MRACLGFVVAVVLALSAVPAGRADDFPELKALVEKAIKATGGEEKLKKLEGATLKARGSVHAENMEIPFTVEGSAKALDRWRLDFDANVNGTVLKIMLVFNSDKVWAKVNEQTSPGPEELVTALKTDTYALRLAHTLLPLKAADCKLSPMGEIQIGGKPAVGLKAVVKDRPEVNVYFDKETGLLARIDLQVRDTPGMPEVTHEVLFLEPKEMGGLKHFSKLVLNREGKKVLEVELTEVTGDDKLDGNLFEKP